MAEIYFTTKALEDLVSIWDYTVSTWSERQAEVYYDKLMGSCEKIALNPKIIGRRYKQIAEGLFGFKVDKHVIFYRIVSNDNVEIIRILHENMDLPDRLRE